MGGLFASRDRTTYRTPTVRTDEALAIAASASGVDTPEQQALLADLARRIQSERDPLVREAIVDSVARFPMPLADQVLQAGLTDSDSGVRQHCCQALGQRGLSTCVPALARLAKEDEEFDVRVAATQALGQLKSPEAVQALAVALEARDPALQYAGVEAMRSATGRDLGGDVKAYLALAKGETPVIATAPPENSTNPLKRWSPF